MSYSQSLICIHLIYRLNTLGFRGFPGDSVLKNLSANAGDVGLIPGLGRSLNGNSLQYSCLGNLIDRGAWWAIVHGITKKSDMTL